MLYLNKISDFLQFVNLSKTGAFRLFSSDNKKTHENKTSFSRFEKGVPFSAHFFCMYGVSAGVSAFERIENNRMIILLSFVKKNPYRMWLN
ncbi:hypothetical protein [Hydrogeniiclostridium mannosilyticum]|uniref:hypothetical protein n=1 Tax=Hydrogeniiclostridium mannosilyticum TaxID=2764322 RepID=UPI00399B4800